MKTSIYKTRNKLSGIITILIMIMGILGADAQPILTLGQHDVSCSGGNNGSVRVKVSGGRLPFSYSWSNGGTTNLISGLTPGTYSVTVTDGNSQSSTASATISGASGGGVNAGGDEIINSGQTVSLNASGTTTSPLMMDDSLDVCIYDVVGGSGNCLFTNKICSDGFNFTPHTRSSSPISIAGADVVNSIDFRLYWTCGNGEWTFLLNGVTIGGTGMIMNTKCTCYADSAGTYPTLYTASGPLVSSNWIVGGNNVLTVINNTDGANGVAGYTATIKYTRSEHYSWTPTIGLSNANINNPDASPIITTDYTVSYQDFNGCVFTDNLLVSVNLAGTVTSTDVNCNGNSDGSISISGVSGGYGGPYEYSIDGGSSYYSSSSFSGLAPGGYSVIIKDVAAGLSVPESVTISEPAVLSSGISGFAYSGGFNISCNGASDGSIDFAPTGGHPSSYAYNWSNGANTEDQSGLTAGTYDVTVTDANGCSTTNTITLTEPALLTSGISSPTVSGGYNITCSGASDGSIDFAPTGGDAPTYTYNWSNGANTQDQTGLGAGTYNVTVTDGNGCSTTNTITLTQPSVLTSGISSPTVSGGFNITCNGASNGSIDFAPTGGDASTYTYNWSNGANTQDQTGLGAGTYNVTVSDANGCTTNNTITLSQPAVLTSNISSPTVVGGYNIACNGALSGSVNFSPTGGNAATYAYTWSNGSTTQNLSGVGVGTYNVTVTDGNGCSTTNTISLSEPTALSASLSSPTVAGGYNIGCNGSTTGSISLVSSGGTPSYTYHWSDASTTQNLSSLGAGTYSVTVTDGNSCTNIKTIILTQPTVLIASAGSPISFCNGSTGVIGGSPTASGGTPTYNYSWSGTTGLSNSTIANPTVNWVNNTASNVVVNYVLTVSDANGCISIANTSVTVTPSPTVSISTLNVPSGCQGEYLTLKVNGSNPQSFLWSTSETTQSINVTSSAVRSVQVRFNGGCVSTTAVSTTFTPANYFGSYTIYAVKHAQLTRSTVFNGGVGVWYPVSGPTFGLDLLTNSTVTASGTFGKASRINVAGGSVMSNQTIAGASTTFPTFETSPFVGTNNVTVGAGQTVTLPDSLYGNISIGANATVTFSQDVVNANKITMAGNSGVTLKFAKCAKVRVTTTLDFGPNSIINPDGKIVTFYVKQTDSPANQLITQAVEIASGSTVNANIMASNGMIRVAAGTALTPSRLTGFYFADQIYSADYTEWYWNTACNSCSLLATITHVDNTSCTSGSNGALTARATGGTAPYSYVWSNSQTGYATSSLATGSYTVTVTDATGLTATTSKSVAVQSYVILANNTVGLTHDTIRSGAVAVTGATGTASLSFSTATASNSFVQAQAITLTNGSVVTTPVYMVSSEVAPTFEANALTSVRDITVGAGLTTTLNALNDTVFRNISLGVGSTLIFGKSRINVTGTIITAANSTVKFSQCAKVKAKTSMSLAAGTIFNPDGFDVIVHLQTTATIGAGSTVNATINGFPSTSSITTSISLSTAPTRMTGEFIAGTVTGGDYTIWNQKTNCSNSCLTPVNARMFEKPLVQSSPNPFSDKTRIQFTLPDNDKVQLSIFSTSGRLILALPEQKVNGGQEYTYEFDGTNYTEGIYIYRLITSSEVYMGKMILVR